ncbi:MAG: hypothetical protein HW374_563 [Bacteroidetes bacterium]|nr:hypothetical protein [Bacteroidota bacterium]
MKSTLVVLLLFVAVPVALIGQERNQYSQLVLVNTAEVLPHMSFSANFGTSLYTTRNSFYRGFALFGLANVIELSLSREGTIANTFGILEPEFDWALKLKILTASEDQPAIALRIQSSLGWNSHKVWSTDIQSFSQALYQRGLWDSHYQVSLTTFQMLASHGLGNSFSIHSSVGIQEVQSRDLWIIVAPAPSIGNGSHVAYIRHEMLLSWSLGLTHEVASQLSLYAELQTVPALSPNIDDVKLNVNRGYLGSLAFRYLPLPAVAFDAGIVFHTSPNTTNYTEVRMGLNTILSIQ